MGFNSQSGSVAFRKQSVAGTFPADFATNARAFKLRGGALGVNRDLLIPDPEIGGGRDVNDALLGAAVFTGDYEFYVRLDGIRTLLEACLGARVQGPGGVNEVNTITKTGTWSAGTFTITFNAQTTAAIPYNADAITIQAALIALSNIGPYDVTVTGGPLYTTPIVITFEGALTGTVAGAPVTITTTSVTGTTPGAGVVRNTTGLSNVGTYNDLIVPVDSPTLPFLGVEENVAGNFDVYRYTDTVVNTLHFEADANGYFMGTAGLIARLQAAQASAVDVSNMFDNGDMIVGTNVSVAFGGATLPGKSLKVDINNNFESDDYRLGSLSIGDLTGKRRECTIGVNIREQDKNMWRQAAYGTSSATSVGGVVTKNDVAITATTYSTIPGSSPLLASSISFKLPTCAIKPYVLGVSGDNVIDSDIEIQALRPDNRRQLVRVNVVTGVAAVA